MVAYVKVANVDDLPPGQAKLVIAGDQRVALFNVDGTCYTISDTCTHRGGPLSEGTLENDVVTCPLHRARFCVRDGQVQGPPAQESVMIPGAGHGRRDRNRVLSGGVPS